MFVGWFCNECVSTTSIYGRWECRCADHIRQSKFFCVNIPESIDLNDSEGYLFTADYVYITDPQMLCVYAPSDGITMTNEWGANGSVSLYTSSSGNCVATFLRNQTTSDTPMYAMFDGQEAGHYEGTATFTIQLQAKN